MEEEESGLSPEVKAAIKQFVQSLPKIEEPTPQEKQWEKQLEKRLKKTLKAPGGRFDELRDVRIHLSPSLDTGKAAKVVVDGRVQDRYVELKVPFAILDQVVNKKAKTKARILIHLKELRVTEEVADKLLNIQLEGTPQFELEGADLTPISNATLLRLMEKFKLWKIGDAMKQVDNMGTMLPIDLDADAMLAKCKGNKERLHIYSVGPIKDYFAFGIDTLADYVHSHGSCWVEIQVDHIQGGWYSLYEKLREMFLADPKRHHYSLHVYHYSRTQCGPERNSTIIKNATGEGLNLCCEPSYWDRIMKCYTQFVHIERYPQRD